MDNTAPLSSASLPAQPEAVDLTGRVLGDFQVLRRLGEGGMGQVYLAEQISLKRKVALKLLKAELASNPLTLQRFKAEAEAVARATHANIVQVYAIGSDGGLHYMALEYIEGRNLRDYLSKKGAPNTTLAISLMRQVASALQRAAELGIIHRDIKPENILLTRKGEVKVADFGLARDSSAEGRPLNLTQTGVTMGTPLYMSPEQVQGQPLDPRTDIYSFGITCYHMLAGHPPYQGGSPFDVAMKHLTAEPVPLSSLRPDLPPTLCEMVHKMMAKKPEDRYQTCRELLRDLGRLRDSLALTSMGSGVMVATSPLPSPAPTAQAVEVELATSRRKRGGLFWTALVTSLLLALAAGAGLGWLRLHSASPAPEGATGGDSVGEDPLATSVKHEQFLKEGVKLYANPGGDPEKLKTGLEMCRDLGVLYLDQGHWEEADSFFQELSQDRPNPVPQYVYLGKLGHAVVLGLQSQTEASVKSFVELLPEKQSLHHPLINNVLFKNPKMSMWIAEAMEYNYKNAPDKFPAGLEKWRKASKSPAAPPEKSPPGKT
jgi:serine/threonine-protein kinase